MCLILHIPFYSRQMTQNAKSVPLQVCNEYIKVDDLVVIQSFQQYFSHFRIMEGAGGGGPMGNEEPAITVQTKQSLNLNLTHLSLASHNWDIVKERRPG